MSILAYQSAESFVSYPLLGGATCLEYAPALYRSEASRLCSKDDRSPTFSHMTVEFWQKPSA